MIDGVVKPAAGDEVAGGLRCVGRGGRLSWRRFNPQEAIDLSCFELG